MAISVPIIIAFVLPISILIYFIFRKKDHLLPYLIGFLTFFVFQLLVRIPLLQILNMQPWFILKMNNIWVSSLFLGVTAAIFEEFGRFITMRLFMKKKQTDKYAISFGLGHWACEALMLVGINYLFAAFSTPSLMLPHDSLMIAAGLERLFVLPVHVAMSVLVMRTIKTRKFIPLLIALLGHTIIDGSLGPLQVILHLNVFQIELVIAFYALIASIYLFKIIKGGIMDEKN